MPDNQEPTAASAPEGGVGPYLELHYKLLNAFPVMAMVLDAERRIRYANQALVDFVGAGEADRLRGLLPGEALGCTHAAEAPASCGTTEACGVCGGHGASLAAQIGHAAAEPYRVRRRTAFGEEALDLCVWSTPIDWEGMRCTLLCAIDVGDRLRRSALERCLFQEAAGLAQHIGKLADSLERAQSADQQRATVQAIGALSRDLAEAIQTHSDLAAAERGDLAVRRERVASRELLEGLLQAQAERGAEPGRLLRLDPGAEEVVFESDPALVRHVVGHMIRNGLEASADGETVTVGCRRGEGIVEFWVHNPGVMPHQVQLQVFQRSFTTKGPGRGLGTYMMRLVSERYLGGRVDFRSDAQTGTVFTAHYPLGAGEE